MRPALFLDPVLEIRILLDPRFDKLPARLEKKLTFLAPGTVSILGPGPANLTIVLAKCLDPAPLWLAHGDPASA